MIEVKCVYGRWMECYSEQDLFAATDLSLNAEQNSAYLLNSIFFCLVSAVVEEVIIASQASMKE